MTFDNNISYSTLIKLSVLFFSLYSNIIYAQFYIRPSVGNGKPFYNFSTKYNNSSIFETSNSPNILNLNPVKNRVLELPQIGLMIEYKLNQKHQLGIGIIAGRTESASYLFNKPNYKFNNGYYGGATLQKFGIEYTYEGSIFSKKKEIIKYNLLFGCFIATHDYNDYDTYKNSKFLKSDSLGVTIDSTSYRGEIINYRGIIISPGIRFIFPSKGRFKNLSLTALLDLGLINIVKMNGYYYRNYKKDVIISETISNGSQFKIYLSIPILILNPKKYKRIG
jgi:hypothetical protein